MSALSLLSLSLLVVNMDSTWCQQTVAKSRLELTQDVDALTEKVELLQEKGRLAEEVKTLGQTLTAEMEKLGQTLSGIRDHFSPTTSCAELGLDDTQSKIHTITANGCRMRVYCDMITGSGGWTVIQRRVDGQVDFYRNWTDYQRGFGDLTHEFWLGLDKIHCMTSSQNYSLRVDLQDWDGSTAYAEYRDFSISGPDDFYRLHVGEYSGTAEDSISTTSFSQNNQQFTTLDQDHDPMSNNCVRDHHLGAWWYGEYCGYADLNGVYNGTSSKGIIWYKWKNDNHSYKHAAMKIRPQT